MELQFNKIILVSTDSTKTRIRFNSKEMLFMGATFVAKLADRMMVFAVIECNENDNKSQYAGTFDIRAEEVGSWTSETGQLNKFNYEILLGLAVKQLTAFDSNAIDQVINITKYF